MKPDRTTPSPKQSDVALVSMPFVSAILPSIGLGLLHSWMGRIGVSSQIFYFSVDFVQRISPVLHRRIEDQTAHSDLVGEWIFSDALFDHHDEHEVERFRDSLRSRADGFDLTFSRFAAGVSEELIEEIVDIRTKVEPFLDECLDRLLEAEPRIVGFTSVFQQNVASLALAQRIKERSPDTFVVFGGANCEGVMGREMSRQFPFIDAIVSGEGDLVFPEMVQRILAGRPLTGMTGVILRNGALPIVDGELRAHVVEDMDCLPDPDYSDFFREHQKAGLGEVFTPHLLFETSRGCWWGEKHHCTFCGLNGETLNYRSKSAARSFEELERLATLYPGHTVEVVDNILDMKYFKEFLPRLAESDLDVDLFFEVKANLKKPQVEMLKSAKINLIQPGIENLSDQVLDIMDKGVTGLQNIQLLKWARGCELKVHWNILVGFPGEDPAEYEQMADTLPLLTHLQPPLGCFKVRIDRFSPNFDRSKEKGFRNLRPYPAYDLVYPLDPESVARMAYFFQFDYDEPRDVGAYTVDVRRQVSEWAEDFPRSVLSAVDRNDRLLILDTRQVARRPVTVLEGKHRQLYLDCESVQSASTLGRIWERRGDPQWRDGDLADRLAGFVEEGLMLRQDDRYLSLAILAES
jgi:ribosomal peptide maturation radical SAM protein 1